jgi:hypothetical protein
MFTSSSESDDGQKLVYTLSLHPAGKSNTVSSFFFFPSDRASFSPLSLRLRSKRKHLRSMLGIDNKHVSQQLHSQRILPKVKERKKKTTTTFRIQIKTRKETRKTKKDENLVMDSK